MVRPGCRPRVAGRGVGIPQGRQCSLRAGSDRRQGMRNQFTVPSCVVKASDVEWRETYVRRVMTSVKMWDTSIAQIILDSKRSAG